MNLMIEVALEDERWLELGDLDAFVERTLETALRRSAARIGSGAGICVLFCDDARIRELNKQWRGFDKPTNVLSFPAGGEIAAAPFLGDVAIAFETVRREAQEEGKSLADHARHMIVHGFLHLLGHDHENDDTAQAMEALEAKILHEMGVADPYADERPDEAASR